MTHLYKNRTQQLDNLFMKGNASQVINTSWTKVDFKSDLFDINNFPFDPYDATNKEIVGDPNISFDQHYIMSFQFQLINGLLCTDINFKLEINADAQRSAIPILEEQRNISQFTIMPVKFSDGFFIGEQWRDNGASVFMKTDLGSIQIDQTTMKIIRP